MAVEMLLTIEPRDLVLPGELLEFEEFVRVASQYGVGVAFHRYEFKAYIEKTCSVIGPCTEEEWWQLWETQYVPVMEDRAEHQNAPEPGTQ